MIMCNPPFFASLAEMKEGRELKAEQAHTVRSASVLAAQDTGKGGGRY
jgi:23S rRNA A1618 N6-methylase RlmF